MKRALVVSNGIGAEQAFPSTKEICFDVVQVVPSLALELAGYDLLVVPNGADHVAMFRNRVKVREFLDQGKALACFCGWFMDWIPGNRWIHDNEHPTKQVRHYKGDDPLGLLDGVDLGRLDHNEHGISGWWSCGYIQAATGANTLIYDTWGRSMVITDSVSTAGLMFLTASGPLGSYGRYYDATSPIARMYENFLNHICSANQLAIG